MNVSRRVFLLGSGAIACLPGKAAASNRITVGVIGVGRQTVQVNLKQFLPMPDVQIVAVCDVDAWRLDQARQQVEDGYAKQAGTAAYKGCRTHRNFHEVLADASIDAVFVGTPDHWHVPVSIEAIKAGKDVSCEKPLTRFILQGRELSDLVTQHQRVFRNDSEFRSLKNFYDAVELVRNGRIGKIHTIRVGVPKEYGQGPMGCPAQPDMPVPAELDYEQWQGPAPHAPYTEKRVHKPHSYERGGWMRHTYYDDGMLTNWGAHLVDIAQWGNNTERTGPVEVEARGTYPPAGSFWNVLAEFEAQYRYANGTRLYYQTDGPHIRFEGSDGWIATEYGKPVQAEPAAILTSKIREDEIQFPFKSDKQDFIDAVKTRGRTLEDAEVAHRTIAVCHLANIAIQLGKRLEFDPVKERFIGDDRANTFLGSPILR